MRETTSKLFDWNFWLRKIFLVGLNRWLHEKKRRKIMDTFSETKYVLNDIYWDVSYIIKYVSQDEIHRGMMGHRSHSAAPMDSPSIRYRGRSQSPTGHRSLSPPEHRSIPYSHGYVHTRYKISQGNSLTLYVIYTCLWELKQWVIIALI